MQECSYTSAVMQGHSNTLVLPAMQEHNATLVQESNNTLVQ